MPTATQEKDTTFADVAREHLVPVNNGFGSWEGFLFGEFDSVGQRCLNMADHLTLDAAMERANVNYHVSMYPAQCETPNGTIIVPDRFVTVRDDTNTALGTVGAGYTVVQTRDAFGVAEAIDIASEGKGNFIGMAEMETGNKIAALYAMPALTLGTDEQVLPVCLIWTSHDGSRAIEVTFVPVRLACFNGNLWHVKGSSAVYKVKHTVTAENRLAIATESLAQGSKFFADWQKEATKLLKAKLSRANAMKFLELLVPEPEKTVKASTIAEKVRESILARYTHSPNLENVRDTKWGMLQAVAEYVDYDHRTRIVDDGRDTEVQENELRFLRAVSNHPLKESAHKILTGQAA